MPDPIPVVVEPEVKIEIVDGPAVDAAPAAAPGPESPDAGIDALKRQVDELALAQRQERDGRLAAEARAADAERRAGGAATEAQTLRRTVAEGERAQRQSELQTLTDGVKNLESELENLAAQKATAVEAGDHKASAQIDVRIARGAARLETLEAGRATLDAELKKPVETKPETQPQPESAYQKQEDWLAKQPPAAAAWIRRNRDRFFNDQTFQRKAIAASSHAASNLGMVVDSEDHFKFVEEEVGLRQRPTKEPAQPAPESAAARAVQPGSQPAAPAVAVSPTTAASRPMPAPAAPPSRSAPPSQSNSGGGTVRLTKEELEFCKTNDINPVNYARRRDTMKEAGEIGIGR